MMMITMPAEFRIGATMPVKINFEPTTLTWVSEAHVVIGENDVREIMHHMINADGTHAFMCAAADDEPARAQTIHVNYPDEGASHDPR